LPDNGIVEGAGEGIDDGTNFDVFVSSQLQAKVSVSEADDGGWYISGYLWCA
jgi:hypothetical protein